MGWCRACYRGVVAATAIRGVGPTTVGLADWVIGAEAPPHADMIRDRQIGTMAFRIEYFGAIANHLGNRCLFLFPIPPLTVPCLNPPDPTVTYQSAAACSRTSMLPTSKSSPQRGNRRNFAETSLSNRDGQDGRGSAAVVLGVWTYGPPWEFFRRL